MSIILADEYPGRVGPATAEYPTGQPINRVTEGTGTPYDEKFFQDIAGFFQYCIANGAITPSEVPDNALASDAFDGLLAILALGTAAGATLGVGVGEVATADLTVLQSQLGVGNGEVPTAELTVLQSQLGVATDKVALAQNLVLRTTGTEFAVYGGTANAITLTTSRPLSALTKGNGFWFIPTVTNTLATTCKVDAATIANMKTITGVDLPADYLRVGIPTFMFYDGTNLICDRQIETVKGDPNGDYTRFADGSVRATLVTSYNLTVTGSSGSVFWSNSGRPQWVYPTSFIAIPAVTHELLSGGGGIVWVGGDTALGTTTTQTTCNLVAAASLTVRDFDFCHTAEGYWY